MADKKIIVVFGATGAQGGGLVRAILDDAGSEFAVRAVTRDAGSDKAKELANMGAEVVTADIDDAASLQRVLANAYGAYFVTFFWAHMSAEKENAEVKAFATAAKEAGLKHVIWSTLEDVREYVPLSDDSMPKHCMASIKYRISTVKVNRIIILQKQVCQQHLCWLPTTGITLSTLVWGLRKDRMESII